MRKVKKTIGILLSALFFLIEIFGFFFVYALAVYVASDGAMVGRLGMLLILVASILSTFGLFLAVLKWGE